VPLAVARSGDRQHHVTGLWPLALREDLRKALTAEGLRKAEDFVARYNVAIADWPIEPFDPFFNVNTPDDIEHAHALAARYG